MSPAHICGIIDGMTSPAAKLRVQPGHVMLGMLFLVLPWAAHDASHPSQHPFLLRAGNMLIAFSIGFVVFSLHAALVALAARALGDRVIWVSIGVGPKLWSRSRSSTTFIVQTIPASAAHAIVTARAKHQALRTAIALFAAALVILGAVVLVVELHPMTFTEMMRTLGRRLAPDVLFIIIAGWIVFNAAVVVLGLLVGAPGWSGVTPTVAKARRVLGAAVFASRAGLRGERTEALAIARAGLEEDPENIVLLTIVADVLVQLRDPTAFDRLVELRERTPASRLRVAVVDLWAWEAYLRDEVEHRDEACKLLEALVRGEPDNLSQLDTYAHVLLWAGRDAAAEPHLERAESGAPTASCRASSACGLAILHARRGDFASARRWMARAREHDSTHMLLPRAAALVEVPGTERP